MKANELRIGNWAYNNKDVQVTSNMIHNYDIGIYDLNPIPLTEEWLLKFGFERFIFKVDTDYQKTSDILYKLQIDTSQTLTIKISKPFLFPMIKCTKQNQGYYLRGVRHVHELQNLYFALTRQELNFKDKYNEL